LGEAWENDNSFTSLKIFL